MSYSDKLKDPRWQRKRLEIMERDQFQCQKCFDKESTLTVHHKWYNKGIEPWGYSNDCYITFCEFCHNVFHKEYDDIKHDHIPILAYGVNKTDLYLYHSFLSKALHNNGKSVIKHLTDTLKSMTINKDEL